MHHAARLAQPDDKLEFPDQMVFDLDPSGDEFGAVKATARALAELLGRLELTTDL